MGITASWNVTAATPMKSVRQSQECVDRLNARRAGMASHARHVSRMLQSVFNVVLLYKWCVQEFLLRVKLDTVVYIPYQLPSLIVLVQI